MQAFLFDEFDAQVGISTIRNILERSRWLRKAVTARAAERSSALRNAWISIQKSWTAEQLVFLDESAANERTGDRKYGWSPEGTICGVARPLKRSERWSILPALTVNGYLSYLIL
jgi:hypothetical protein